MGNRLNVWVSAVSSSVTVVTDGIERTTNGREFGAVLEAMQAQDRAVLERFCVAVLDAKRGGVAVVFVEGGL